MENIYVKAVRYLVELDSKIEELKHSGEKQQIHPSVFIAEGVRILGNVTIGEGSSIWFNAVLRGDEGPIIIGKNTNIQDCCVLHSDSGVGVVVGNWVTIGHGAVVRGANIGDNVTIGMNSTVMTGALIPDCCVIGAHSFVSYGTRFPPRTLIIGTPAKVVRELSEAEIENSRLPSQISLKLKQYYQHIREVQAPDKRQSKASPNSH